MIGHGHSDNYDELPLVRTPLYAARYVMETISSPLAAWRWRDWWVLLTRGLVVPVAYEQQQAALVRIRIRALAPVIALLTLAWIPIDAIGLAGSEMARIFPLRLALAACLLQLARASARLSMPVAAHLFVWLQVLGFGAMQLSLEPAQGSVLRIGYGLFPFVIAVQLAVFPSTWGFTSRLALGAVTLLIVPALLMHGPPGAELLNDLWLLGLIVAIAAWASHSQLNLLVALLGARVDASHDVLTGLANRRLAGERLEVERVRSLRYGTPVSVLMVDLDHFKRVNDQWGHASGDLVLKSTAQVLKDELRSVDLCARHGGEEFLVILPSTDQSAAMEVGERLRERIAQNLVPNPGTAIRISTSIGVATLQRGESAASVVDRADAALYRAKTLGRNRCIAAFAVDEPLTECVGTR